ncbi:MAG: flagellar M-ring protein FliF [Spirochaetes bacterium GWF1_51_8]|nr:MAG: flagellar M-ring protein FliF [Spirochaetes bacterium GWF1_51_8]
MPNFGEIIARIQEFLKKLNTTQKLIAVGAVVALILAVVFLSGFSTTKTYSLLYKSPLSQEDYARVTKKLEEMGVKFETKDDQYILVKDEQSGSYLRMKLGQEGIIPSGIVGWELFDVQKFNVTEFEQDINKQRALIGEITKHLKMLDDLDDVSIQISFPEEKFYSSFQAPTTASVILTPAPYVDLSADKKKIKGIVELVAKGIPDLKPENVVVVDNNGNVLSDLLVPNDLDDNMKIAREQLKILEREKAKLIAAVRKVLVQALPEKRFAVSANVEFDWTKKTVSGDYIVPIELGIDPLTGEPIKLAGTELSKKQTKEDFKGPAYIPEGAPGVENSVPPGMKDKIDKYTHYTKDEDIVNMTHSKEKIDQQKSPYEIKKITVGVSIDGYWEILRNDQGEEIITNGGSIARLYHDVPKEELKKYKNIIEMEVGFDEARGDKVVVENIMFDHSEEFEKEDAKIRQKIQLRKTLIASIIVLFFLFVGTLVYRAIAREMERRRRLREEELARQQQAMREAALRAAEEEAATVELSIEEKARMELLENAINMSRERPDDVARLIRTWLAEE